MATLAFASPVFAQDTPSASPQAPAPQDAKSPEVIAFDAKSKAFGVRLAQLQSEFNVAIAAANGDQAKGMADIETLLARYEPEIDAFALDLEAFFDGQIAAADDDTRREALIATKAAKIASLHGMADQVRTIAAQFITAAAAAPAAPATSR
ncbi:hypothetical protein D3C72_1197560 [compost metagenome]